MPRHIGRWIAIGLASLLLHLAILDVLPHWSLDATDDDANDEPLHVRLMPTVEPVEAPSPAPPPVEPDPKPRPRTVPPRRGPAASFVPDSNEPVPQVLLRPPGESAPAIAPAAPDPIAPASAATPTVALPASSPPAPSPAPSPLPVPAPVPAAPSPPTVAPQSARLRYKVLRIDTKNFNSVHYYGIGSIDWSTDEGRYRSDLVAAIDFLLFKVNVLESHSEGSIAPSGLEPDRYTEAPKNRSPVATNFNRDARQSISFSASPATVPLQPGAQDRLSVLFQIGALLLADPQQSAAGGRIAIPVAGVRGNVEQWLFEIVGVEAVDAAGSTLETTHLRYVPRPGSNDRTIDVWIARGDGYPARVLYTEPNGNTTEMTLDGIGAIR